MTNGSGERASQSAATVSAAAEIERLHALLDKQPSCLMRIGTDGTLLAVSDTALNLLGASELAQALGTNFGDRLRGDAGIAWTDFVQRVSGAGSGSAECEMESFDGARRTVILLGVSLSNHPDGASSLLVAVRDLSTARRLEASLLEQEGVRRSLQASLDQATATILALRERLEQATSALHTATDAAALAMEILTKRDAE